MTGTPRAGDAGSRAAPAATGAPVLRTVLVLVLATLLGSLLLASYVLYRIIAQGDQDEQRPADAIVVLGAAQFSGVPGGVFEARLAHAVELYHAGLARFLVVTGGKLPGDLTTEAATARTWAIAHGVPRDAILAEDTGRNTLESLENVRAIFRSHSLESAVFVSDRSHMLRVLRMASDLGIVAWGSPTATSPSDLEPVRRARALAHELAGLAAYYVGLGRLIEDPATANTP